MRITVAAAEARAVDADYRVFGVEGVLTREDGAVVEGLSVLDISATEIAAAFGVEAVTGQPVYQIRKTQVPDDPQGGTLTVGGAVLTIAEAVDWTEREWRLFCQRA